MIELKNIILKGIFTGVAWVIGLILLNVLINYNDNIIIIFVFICIISTIYCRVLINKTFKENVISWIISIPVAIMALWVIYKLLILISDLINYEAYKNDNTADSMTVALSLFLYLIGTFLAWIWSYCKSKSNGDD